MLEVNIQLSCKILLMSRHAQKFFFWVYLNAQYVRYTSSVYHYTCGVNTFIHTRSILENGILRPLYTCPMLPLFTTFFSVPLEKWNVSVEYKTISKLPKKDTNAMHFFTGISGCDNRRFQVSIKITVTHIHNNVD